MCYLFGVLIIGIVHVWIAESSGFVLWVGGSSHRKSLSVLISDRVVYFKCSQVS